MAFPFATRRGRGLGAVIALVTAALSAVVAPGPSAQAGDESISVDFSVAGGSPTYRASGWIYGMTEDAAGPADHFFRDVKFRYMRAGGAQLDGPGGWVAGKYDRRWNATRAQLLRTRALGGEFILLLHDLWGADGYPISRFPGDNGNWTDYDNFLTRVINDVRATGAPVQWDLWNEPNLNLFWNRPRAPHVRARPGRVPAAADRRPELRRRADDDRHVVEPVPRLHPHVQHGARHHQLALPAG